MRWDRGVAVAAVRPTGSSYPGSSVETSPFPPDPHAGMRRSTALP